MATKSKTLTAKESVMEDYYTFHVIDMDGDVVIDTTDSEKEALEEAQDYAENCVDENNTEYVVAVYKLYKAVRATSKVSNETVTL